MNERLWLHLVQVVEGSCYVQTYGSSLAGRQIFHLHLSPQTGGHQLCQDDHLSFLGGSDELEQVGVAYSGGHVHLTPNQLHALCWETIWL